MNYKHTNQKTIFTRTWTQATKPLQIVHTDICGPITPQTWNGNKYFVTFLDDHTHFFVAFLIKFKYRIYECLEIYEDIVTTCFNCKILWLRCDNDGEYVSQNQKLFCQEMDLIRVYSSIYTWELWLCRHLNRTLAKKGLKTSLEANFTIVKDHKPTRTNKPYWEAVEHLMNCMIHTRPATSFAINILSINQSDFPYVHWSVLKRVLRYLKGTENPF